MSVNNNIDSTNEFDSYYFSELDTTQKFYYESFICGDAYVKSSDNTVGIDLAIKDYEWLVNYKNNLGITNKIYIRDCRDTKNSITASVRKKDKQWVKDLAQYGVVPRKTGKESLPVEYCSSEAEASAMLLGIFDADASIYQETKSGRYRVSFCGNETVCKQINDTIKEYTAIEPNKMALSNRKCSFIFSTSHGKKDDLIDLFNFMYQNKELHNCYLARKYAKWSQFINATKDVA
jgi:hypothetical protein